jgi:cell division protease FtsH
MTFVPHSRGNTAGLLSPVRTLLFWVLMVLLAVFLWQMVSKNGPSDQGSKLSYSDFMNQVDANNVQTANVGVAQTTADVSGKLRQPEVTYRSTIPRDTLTALLDKLRKAGVDVQVSQEKTGAANFVIGIAPIILLVGLWLFMMRMRMKQGSNPPNQPTPGALG